MPKPVPRQRKHKAVARQSSKSHNATTDTNVAEILPSQQRERAEKKSALKQELLKEAHGKISGKKRKRMDKYIETKLRREENLVLLRKLAAQKVDTNLLRSSKTLGSGTATKREIYKQAIAQIRAGVDVERNQKLLLKKHTVREISEPLESKPKHTTVSQQQTPASELEPCERIRSPSASIEVVSALAQNSTVSHLPSHVPESSFGTGLKRPLEKDESGQPILRIRKRRKGLVKAAVPEAEIKWEGFSSDESREEAYEVSSIASQTSEPGSSTAHMSVSDSDESKVLEDTSSGYDSESGSDTDMEHDNRIVSKKNTSVFKAWATQQMNEAIGFVPTSNLATKALSEFTNFQPRPPEQDPLPPELATNTSTDATRKAFSVNVERLPTVQESRLRLPVVPEEHKIMEAIHNNDVVVIWGTTGSGKTTQVPQFLYEAGYGTPDGPTPGLIGITQPRRVAAISMSKRVSDELGSHGSKVAYQIRFDTSTSARTAMKFMTDGILLREITQDFSLQKYSAIVIDEAHERSVNTDILIGMLSRIVDLRRQLRREDPNQKPLKLIIMSATLRVADFTENKQLFRNGPPPIIKVEGRQYTITNHFARHTQRDYVEEMYRKLCRGHRKLPEGAILVFLTGQNEISHLAKRLQQVFPSTQGQRPDTAKVMVSPADTPLETEDIELGFKDHRNQTENKPDSEDSGIMDLDDETDKEFDVEDDQGEEVAMRAHILPLYSQLPTEQQLRVFEPPPEGSRLIILATNVAETSLTIPGVRYVFDCGRVKEKKYDPITGVQSFEIGWISKASANQRAGRAGRAGPGHCYRLYSSAVFERDFEEYAVPEISRTPLESVVLQLKSMGAPVVDFPFPTPPDRESLHRAENLLSFLGALSSDGQVTRLGHELSLYPLNPRFARMAAMGVAQGLVAETIALVAALSVPELIIPESKLGLREAPAEHGDGQDSLEAEERSRLRKAYNAAQAKLNIHSKQSDGLKLSNAVCAHAYEEDSQRFCDDMFLNMKSMNEASQLRIQLTNIVRAHRLATVGPYQAKLPAPSERTNNLLAQICAAGFIDQIAMRADLAPVPPCLPRKPKSAIDVPYITLFATQNAPSSDPNEKFVFLHPSSVLARVPSAKLPGYIIYHHLQRATSSTVEPAKRPKTRMHPLTPVTRPQIINIALNTPLLQVSKPKGRIVDLPQTIGASEGRECEVELSLVGEKGTQGWSLGSRTVRQRKERDGRFVIEKILG